MTNSSDETTEIKKIIEVHNCWTLYGLNDDGTEVEQPIAQKSRPQDWGNPNRWHYERCQFNWLFNGDVYINHVYCWTDLKLEPYEYLQLFAPLIVQILMPGDRPEVCGRDYLASDDFWESGWGEMPPYYDEDYEEEEED